MKKNIRKKLLGILTAAALICGCVPLQSVSTVFGEEAQLSELEQKLCDTASDDFMTLSYIALCAYAETATGLGNPLSDTCTALLDVNESGALDILDAYTLLLWYAHLHAYGTLPDEAQAFVDNWNIPVATPTTTLDTTTDSTASTKAVYSGVDVSRYQGNVNWTAVKNAGKEFALIRAGYGKYASQEDPYFDQNMKNAQAAGIACGAYWFSYAASVADAKKEAELFANVIEGYSFEYPLVFDIEAPVHQKMTVSEVSAIINAFCSVMESKGYYVCIYSYASFLNTMVSQTVLNTYDIWVAHFYVDAPSYTRSSYGIWQYTDSGSVNGISGDVDLDYSYRNYPLLMQTAHKNGY